MAAAGNSVIPELPIMRSRAEGEQRATALSTSTSSCLRGHSAVPPPARGHQLVGRRGDRVHARGAVLGMELHNMDDQLVQDYPDTVPVRLVLVFVMLASLLLAVAIPEGFGGHALLFACAYAGLQIGRNTFVVAVTPRGQFNQNFRQILAWSVLFGATVVAGGIVDGEALRWILWLGALSLDLAAPLVTYWLPGGWNYTHERVADRGHPFRRALPAVRDHRARGERRAGRRRRLGDGVERRRRRRAHARLPFLDSAVVAVLRAGGRHGARADPHGHGRGAGPDRPGHLHLPTPPDHRRDRPCRGRRRAS